MRTFLVFGVKFYYKLLKYSWHLLFQGYKRLRKHQTEGVGSLYSSDRSNANSSHSKEDKSSRGGTLAISVKFKKGANEEASSKQNEHKRDEKSGYELGKTVGEPPPIEIGPKRLKVKVLQYLSLEEELNNS